MKIRKITNSFYKNTIQTVQNYVSQETLTQNSKILLCFCDMRQPASQRCVLALRERARSLSDNGVIPALLQCSTGSIDRVNAWMQKNEIEFPTGRMQERLEQVLRAWRVEELPWLVLTDTDHVVIAEGFALAELNEQLNAAGGAKP